MPGVRTFIALDPGEAIREQMVALQETLRRTGADVKWVEPENLHITLLFLGSVDNRDLVDVCRAVEEAAREQPAFELTIAGTGCFPSARRPRVVWIGISQGVQEVCALHDALEGPLMDLGCYRREERRFKPHVTLGRIRSEKPMERLTAALAKNQDFQAGTTVMREIHIMSSELSPRGPTYTVMSRARLAGR
jgi:2'-5' RNA ligase